MITRRALIGSAGISLTLMAPPALAEEGEKTFEAGAIRQDLDAIWSALREVSPDPFRAAQASQVEAAYRRARAGLAAPMTIRAAWLAISPVLGALNDGHVALGFNDALNAAAQRFPLRLAATEQGDQLLVERDRTGLIPPGSRVVSIEGAPAAALLRTNLAAFGGQTPALARWRVTASGAWTSVALFGAKPGYQMRWAEPGGAQHEAVVTVAAAKTRAAPSEPYSFRWLRKDVGLIDYRRCEDLARFRTFLDSTFAKLKAGSATALIIDVRRNAGGDSDLNDLLWSYAQAKPFRQFGGTVERSSDRLKRAYGHDKYVQLYGEDAWTAPDGAMIRRGMGPADGLVTPGPLAMRFTEPVYLLISAGTFSSGMSCALAAKDYGLATLVGEETGEPANGTGELYSLTTPNLKMQAYLTTKLFMAPKPHPDGQGVVPDVQVDEKVARSDGGHDAVLKRTLALIDARRAVRS